jgi:hypothetical protein
MLRADYHHQRAPSGAFLGVNGRGNAATLPRAPFALEGLRQHRQADGIIPLSAHCTQDETDREQPPNANPNRRAIRFSSIVSLRVNVST